MKTYTTFGALASFKKGQVLKKPSEIAAYYRANVNEGREEGETTLTDESILNIVKSVDGDTEDAEVERVELLLNASDAAVTDEGAEEAEEQETETETVTGDDATVTHEETEEAEEEAQTVKPAASTLPSIKAEAGADVKALAIRMAAKMATDDTFAKELRSDLDAGEKLKRAPLSLMLLLRLLYTAEEMAEWPQPGTTWKLGHNNPDKRKVSVKNDDGVWQDKTIGLYDLVFAALPEGKKLDNDLDAIKVAKKENNSWSALDDTERNSQKKTKEARRTSGRTMIRRAVALHKQFENVRMYLPEIKAYYIMVKERGKDGKPTGKSVPTNATYPIVVKEVKPAKPAGGGDADAGEELRGNTYSVTQFLGFKYKDALDPVIVREKGSVWDAFVGSNNKGADTEDGEEGTPLDVTKVEEQTALIAHWLGNGDNIRLLRKRMQEDVATMQSICRVSLELTPLYAQFKVPFDMAEAGDEGSADRAKEYLDKQARQAQTKKKAA